MSASSAQVMMPPTPILPYHVPIPTGVRQSRASKRFMLSLAAKSKAMIVALNYRSESLYHALMQSLAWP
jgi:hypothetical protein